MPIEYGMLLTLTVTALAVGAYVLYIKHAWEKRPSQEPDSRFEDEVLAQIRRVKETGESIVLRERGWPTVEIHPEKPEQQDPPGKLKGSVKRYDRPTDPAGD